MHCRACRAVMHAIALQEHVVARVPAKERDLAVGLGNRVLDQSARKTDPPVRAEDRAGPRQIGHARRGRIGKADLFQRIEHGMVDAVHLQLG